MAHLYCDLDDMYIVSIINMTVCLIKIGNPAANFRQFVWHVVACTVCKQTDD